MPSEPTSCTPVSDSLLPSASTQTILTTKLSTTLPSIPTSKEASGSAPAGRTVMKLHAYEVPHTAENSRALCTGEKGDGKSSSIFHRATPDSMCESGVLTKGNTKSSEEKLVCEQMDGSSLSMVNASLNHRFFLEDDAPVQAVADKHVQAKDGIHHRLQRELLNIKARMDQQREFERNSFATIRGEISRLSEVAVRLASSLGRTNNHSIQTKPEQSSVPVAPACVAPEVFGEMPAQNSLQETNGTAPGHHTPIQNSCVSTNISDGKQQQYGFHNLDRQTVFRADGSEHSYFTLPENYPFKRAAHAPVFAVYDDQSNGCKNEFVQVFYGTHERQTNEVEQHESRQASKCFSKPTISPERQTVVVFNLTNEQKSDNEHAVVCVNKAPASAFREDATAIHVPHFSVGESVECSISNNKIELPSPTDSEIGCTHEKAQVHNHQWDMLLTEREVWDPGASALLVTPLNNGNSKDTSWPNGFVAVTNNTMEQQKGEDEQSISDLEKLNGGEDLSVVTQYVEPLLKCCIKALKYRTCDEESQDDDKILWEKNVCRTATGHSILFFLWDPGDTTFHILFTTADSALLLKCAGVYKSVIVQILAEQFCARRALSLKSASMCSDAFGLGCIEVNASALFVLVALCSTGTSCSLPSFETWVKLEWDPGIAISSYIFIWPEMRAVKTLTRLQSPLFNDLQYQLQMSKPFSVWDPGILSLMDMMLNKTRVPNLMDLKQFWAQLLLQCHSWCTTPNVFLQQVDCSATHACHLVSALLPPTQIAASCPSNIKQGIQKNYSANNLLYSQNYLQTWVMDILFITFLPP